MKLTNLSLLLFLIIFVLLITSCNQDDEQRKFEREALNLPDNITEINENGKIIEGSEDPDDWRIAPFFQGLVSLEPVPFPNPLLTNQRLTLNIFVNSIDAVSGLRVLVLYNENSIRLVYDLPTSPLPTGLTSISLSPADIARFDENPAGLYRIIVEDRNGSIITYGDIKIE